MITIPSGIKDPSYRYKMPKMQLMQESRGNGIKTNIFNLEDVAFHLRVPSKAIMKWMCEQLGANMEQTSIIKGKHTYEMLLKHLDKFIERYVLCKGCNYPEIKMFLEGKEQLKSKCNSCGKTNEHDAKTKAGKVFVAELKSGAKQVEDIVEKDKIRDNVESEEDEDKPKKKKDKKDKEKDKKKKSEKEEQSLSDNDEEVTWSSRRISKYPRLWSDDDC